MANQRVLNETTACAGRWSDKDILDHLDVKLALV
jgi:hypothetical protein